jgi:hypothetical protein
MLIELRGARASWPSCDACKLKSDWVASGKSTEDEWLRNLIVKPYGTRDEGVSTQPWQIGCKMPKLTKSIICYPVVSGESTEDEWGRSPISQQNCSWDKKGLTRWK